MIIIGLVTLCFYLSIDDGSIHFTSVAFWLAVVLILMFPFAIISFFSAMKAVVVKDRGLVISYLFSKHKNEIRFSEIKEINSSVRRNQSGTQPRRVSGTLTIRLLDGRMFELTGSQFNNFPELSAAIQRGVSK
jgi:hypothetical protein